MGYVKKILFLKSVTKSDVTTDRDWIALQDGVAKRLGDSYTVEVARFSDLAYLADGAKSRIWHIKKQYDIADFDMVVFRRVGDELEKAISAAHYLSMKSVPFIDSYLLTQGKGKLAGAFLRAAHGLPVPRTFFASQTGYEEIFRDDAPISFPFVIKADNGSKGRDNYLVKSFDELIAVLKRSSGLDMISQTFIPNDGDMRVLVLGNKVGSVILRKGKGDSHLNNTSQGGSAELLDPESLDSTIAADCLAAAQLESLQVAGVDVVIDKVTGDHYFLEVNRAPQLATGAFVDEKLSAYADMVSRFLKDAPSSNIRQAVQTIGRVEPILPPDSGVRVRARIDTGAKTSAIWASNIHVVDDQLRFMLFDESSENFSGEEIVTNEYTKTVVASSNGMAEVRYKIKLSLVLKGRKIRASFTLSDRSDQVYPVLIGRNVLRGKFVVNVKLGKPMHQEERRRTKDLRRVIEED